MSEGNGDLQFALRHPVRGPVVENQRRVAFTVNRQRHGDEAANPLGPVLVAPVFEDRGEIEIVDDERRGKGQGRSLEHLAGERLGQPDAVHDPPLADGSVQRPDRERIGVRDLLREVADRAADRSRPHRGEQVLGTAGERHEPCAQLDALGERIAHRGWVVIRVTPSGEPPDGEFNRQEREQDRQDEHDEHPSEHSPKSFVSVGWRSRVIAVR